MNKISFDTAATLDIEVNKQTSFDLVMELYEPDGSTPRNITGTIHMAISSQASGPVALRLASPADITVAANSITVSRTAVNNTLPAGQYTYRLYESTNGGNTITPLAKGAFTVLDYVR